MGIFGKSETGIPFKVWKTRFQQLKGMSTEAMKAITSGSDAAVITFFDNRHNECKDFFEQVGIPYVDMTNGGAATGSKAIYLIPSAKIDSLWPSTLNSPTVLFHGTYPLGGREANIAERFSNAKSHWCFAALEDPLFKVFGMEKVVSLMETLGMQDNECIEHKFVDKAIASAQQKLKAKVRNEVQANSEEEWFQKNISK